MVKSWKNLIATDSFKKVFPTKKLLHYGRKKNYFIKSKLCSFWISPIQRLILKSSIVQLFLGINWFSHNMQLKALEAKRNLIRTDLKLQSFWSKSLKIWDYGSILSNKFQISKYILIDLIWFVLCRRMLGVDSLTHYSSFKQPLLFFDARLEAVKDQSLEERDLIHLLSLIQKDLNKKAFIFLSQLRFIVGGLSAFISILLYCFPEFGLPQNWFNLFSFLH